MPLLIESKPFRALVPLLLNGRVLRWHFEQGGSSLVMDIPMRKYLGPVNGQWEANVVYTTFVRKTHSFIINDRTDDNKELNVTEVYYSCDNNRVSFTKDNIPVLT